jgi:hypothetical protein
MRGVLVLLLAVLATPAHAGTSGRQRSQHVQKGVQTDAVKIYFAGWIDQKSVTITVVGEPARVGDEYEIIDQNGYRGRARAVRVDDQQQCGPGSPTIKIVTAQLGHPPPPNQMTTMIVAMAPLRRSPDDARVMMQDEIKNPPRLGPQRAIDVGVDLDGDREADLVRVNYICPQQTPAQGQGYGYCIELMARNHGEWKQAQLVVFPECY